MGSDTTPDTARSVVISDHPFTPEPGKEWGLCTQCGLAACTHVDAAVKYVSDADRAVEGTLPGVPEETVRSRCDDVDNERLTLEHERLLLDDEQLEKKKRDLLRADQTRQQKEEALKRLEILKQEGHKDDDGKTLYFAMPWVALDEMAEVMTFGAQKYALFNFRKGMKYSRLWSAAIRHLVAWWRGEENDPETGKSHLAHALCCIGMLLEIKKLNRGEDDRCK